MCTEQKLKPPTNGRNNKSVPKLFAKQKGFLFKNSKSIQKVIPQNLLNMAGAGFGMSLVGGLTERTGSGQTAICELHDVFGCAVTSSAFELV